jgi:hypothetical protein
MGHNSSSSKNIDETTLNRVSIISLIMGDNPTLSRELYVSILAHGTKILKDSTTTRVSIIFSQTSKLRELVSYFAPTNWFMMRKFASSTLQIWHSIRDLKRLGEGV